MDYIVPVEKLDQVLKEHGLPTLEEKSNGSFIPFKLENEEYIKQIKEWYKVNYEIMSNYQLIYGYDTKFLLSHENPVRAIQYEFNSYRV